MRIDIGTSWLLLAVLAASTLHSQDSPTPAVQSRSALHGLALAHGAPLAGVNVFDLETLEGAFTNADGRFTIALRDSTRRNIRIAARHLGYTPVEIVVADPGDSVTITMEPITAIASMSVLAGRYTAESGRTATLSPLEVMTTPGGGDVNSTVRTLPGVQNVDEGSGLFVRGGDYTETRTFIDGAPMFTPYQTAINAQARLASCIGGSDPVDADSPQFGEQRGRCDARRRDDRDRDGRGMFGHTELERVWDWCRLAATSFSE